MSFFQVISGRSILVVLHNAVCRFSRSFREGPYWLSYITLYVVFPGHFGKVHIAWLKQKTESHLQVAVKTLRGEMGGG